MGEFDDRLWEAVRPALPAWRPHGWRRVDLRRLFSGALYVLSTGIAWAPVPRSYGTKTTIHQLHLHLCSTGACPRLLATMREHGYDSDRIDLSRCPRIDGLR